jgi:hypothetical protein
VGADKAYAELVSNYPAALTPAVNLSRLIAAANAKKMPRPKVRSMRLPRRPQKKKRHITNSRIGYAKNKLWPQARQAAEEYARAVSEWQADAEDLGRCGYRGPRCKNKGEENYFSQTALTAWPNAIEVAGAQFELAWMAHRKQKLREISEMRDRPSRSLR